MVKEIIDSLKDRPFTLLERGLIILILGWMAYNIQLGKNQLGEVTVDFQEAIIKVTSDVSAIKKELDDTRPRDVLAAVNELSKDVIKRTELVELFALRSPWSMEKSGWEEWRQQTDKKLERIETRISSANTPD